MRTTDKPFNIDKKLVYEAYKAVKSNAGAAGVDGQTIEQFEADLKSNLYKIWNRMSSGSYFPPPVRAVSIPKKSGGQRILGVPTVADRVAQMVVKQLIEPDLDAIFLADSYGYRPRKSALDAVGVTRQRCWKYDWVLEFDIKGLFDNIDHELLLRAVRKHVTCKWALLYIERWLTAPMEHGGWNAGRANLRHAAGRRGQSDSGQSVPALHVRSVDDTDTPRPSRGVGMRTTGWCTAGASKKPKPSRPSFKRAWRSAAWRCIRQRPRSSTARTGSAKARIRTSSLTFLGYCFRPRLVQCSRDNTLFCGFNPAVSSSALKAMRTTIRDLGFASRRRCRWPTSPGRSIRSYGAGSSTMGDTRHRRCIPCSDTSIRRFVAWAMRKFKRFAAHKIRAGRFLERLARENADLFVHWRIGMTGAFA